jgi:acyl carrier protein
VISEVEAKEVLAAYRRIPRSGPLTDETLLVDLGIDLLDLVALTFALELDRSFGDEVPTALLASLRTVRDFLDLFTQWERDTAVDVEPLTVRSV